MKTKCANVRVVQTPPAPGRYIGVWGGYGVMFSSNGIPYVADAEIGIRSPSVMCLVDVAEDGTVTVEHQPENQSRP